MTRLPFVLHTVFVSYQRLDLTQQAVQSYLETVDVPHTTVIVDNGSDADTQNALLQIEGIDQFCLFNGNHYPGFATNRGFEYAPADASILHRADNDFVFLPNWCRTLEETFLQYKIGQVGLRTDEEELNAQWNVGGNMAVRRELWDRGLRYDERPWPEYEPGYSEDSFLSPAVKEMGWRWTRVASPCIRPISVESPDDPYYAQAWRDRGINGMERT